MKIIRIVTQLAILAVLATASLAQSDAESGSGVATTTDSYDDATTTDVSTTDASTASTTDDTDEDASATTDESGDTSDEAPTDFLSSMPGSFDAPPPFSGSFGGSFNGFPDSSNDSRGPPPPFHGKGKYHGSMSGKFPATGSKIDKNREADGSTDGSRPPRPSGRHAGSKAGRKKPSASSGLKLRGSDEDSY